MLITGSVPGCPSDNIHRSPIRYAGYKGSAAEYLPWALFKTAMLLIESSAPTSSSPKTSPAQQKGSAASRFPSLNLFNLLFGQHHLKVDPGCNIALFVYAIAERKLTPSPCCNVRDRTKMRCRQKNNRRHHPLSHELPVGLLSFIRATIAIRFLMKAGRYL